jgi:hypothetical protein
MYKVIIAVAWIKEIGIYIPAHLQFKNSPWVLRRLLHISANQKLLHLLLEKMNECNSQEIRDERKY